MFPTIAISKLQRNLSKVLREMEGYVYILGNNEKKGAIISAELMEYLEEQGILEEYEDRKLLEMHRNELDEAHEELNKGDYSDMLTFEELCQSL